MKKILASITAATMLFGATAAQADTRPGATEFSQPVTDASGLGADAEDELLLILLGLGGLLGILLAAGSSKGNSPR